MPREQYPGDQAVHWCRLHTCTPHPCRQPKWTHSIVHRYYHSYVARSEALHRTSLHLGQQRRTRNHLLGKSRAQLRYFLVNTTYAATLVISPTIHHRLGSLSSGKSRKVVPTVLAVPIALRHYHHLLKLSVGHFAAAITASLDISRIQALRPTIQYVWYALSQPSHRTRCSSSVGCLQQLQRVTCYLSKTFHVPHLRFSVFHFVIFFDA